MEKPLEPKTLSFQHHFPNFYFELEEFKTEFEATKKDYTIFVPMLSNKSLKVYEIFRNEAILLLGKDWLYLESFSERSIAFHVMYVTILCFIEQELFQIESDLNLMLWTCFLHDICKVREPLIIGKDLIHPFKSGAYCLQFSINHKLIVNNLDEILKLSEKILDCKKKNFSHLGKEIQDHDKIMPIYLELKPLLTNKFVFELFFLVVFHQSIDGCKKFPHPDVLSEEQLFQIIDLRFLHLMKAFMIFDSNSYTILKQSNVSGGLKNRKEFEKTFDSIKSTYVKQIKFNQ